MNIQQIKLFQSRSTDDWSTPSWIYDQLDAEFHFDFDPCPLNSTIDGLAIDWNGSIFVNPPYSKIPQFLQKAHEELMAGRASVIVFLLFANTDTAWFHDYIYGKAEIRFIRGRVKFGTAKHGAMRPSMIVIFRKVQKRVKAK